MAGTRTRLAALGVSTAALASTVTDDSSDGAAGRTMAQAVDALKALLNGLGQGSYTDASSKTSANDNTAVVAGSHYPVDLSNGVAFKLNLPASPSNLARVKFTIVAGSPGVAALTIGRNGHTIWGLSSDYVARLSGVYEFIYYTAANTWVSYFTSANQPAHRRLITDFGAKGDGAADDTAAVQAAALSGFQVHWPEDCITKVTAPIKYGTAGLFFSGPFTQGGLRSKILATFSSRIPLFHRNEGYWDYVQGQYWSYSANSGAGGYVNGGLLSMSAAPLHIENLDIINNYAFGEVAQLFFLSAGWTIRGCAIISGYKGLTVDASFDGFVANCTFASNFWLADSANRQLTTTVAYTQAQVDAILALCADAWSLSVVGHTTVLASNFQGCPLGLRMTGPENHVAGSRIEVCGIGLQIGGPRITPSSGYGTNDSLKRSLVTSISMESNYRGVYVANGGSTSVLSGVEISAVNGSSLWTDYNNGHADYGIKIESASANFVAENVGANGNFSRCGFWNLSQATLRNPAGSNTRSDRPGFVGGPSVIGSIPTNPYHVTGMPWNLATNGGNTGDRQTISAYSDLCLRGLKGVDYSDNLVFPNNFAKIVSLGSGATSVAVTFPGTVSSGSSAFSGTPTVQASANPLPAQDYWFVATIVGPGGEVGADMSGDSTTTCKRVTLNGSQEAVMALQNTNTGSHRVYVFKRGLTGECEGFIEVSGTTTAPVINALTTLTPGIPPTVGTAIPARTEIDANYGIVVTPLLPSGSSWTPTGVSVINRLTSGFTVQWTGATPDASQQLAWMMFRP